MEHGKPAAASGQNASNADFVQPEIPHSNADLTEPTTNAVEARPASVSDRDYEGSVGYRIAAMVAMFLLAFVAIVIWYYGH